MSRSRIPVLLLGQTAETAHFVTENLKPEMEVIHFINQTDIAKADIPRLLQHQAPLNSPAGGVGTQNYTQPAEAVVLGLAYTTEILEEIRTACKDVKPGVPWLAGGLSKGELQDIFKANLLPPPDKYGPIAADKVKKTWFKVVEENKDKKDGLYYWYQDQ